MSDALYRAIQLCGRRARYAVRGLEHVAPGPALFIGNHLGSQGPIRAILSLPLRLHPWAIHQMTDRHLAPSYLYDDFVAKELHLYGWVGRALAWPLAQLAVTLIRGLGAVPVVKQDGLYGATYRQSVALLARRRRLLIFPEDPARPPDPVTGLNPFGNGFAWLCHLYARRTGQPLPVYPFAVQPERRMVCVGPARMLASDGLTRAGLAAAIRALRRQVETDVVALSQGGAATQDDAAAQGGRPAA